MQGIDSIAKQAVILYTKTKNSTVQICQYFFCQLVDVIKTLSYYLL